MWNRIKRYGRQVGDWFEYRLQLKANLMPVLAHPIPSGSAGPKGWFYVFGSASMTLIGVQIATGICLSLVYVPSAAEAYSSLEDLNQSFPFGWFLRAVHNWGASAMVVMVILHMIQVFLFAAYKYPRELTWVFGVFLLLLTLGLAFTGQVLRWDADAYWGVGVGGAMVGRVPWLGPPLVEFVLGGPIIGGNTLSRFFSLHVFVLPGLLLVCLGVHLYLVLRIGISQPPTPGTSGERVDPATYEKEYHAELQKGVPFLGDAMYKDALVSGLTVIVVLLLAVFLGPKGPSGYPDPALAGANPRPDWPFMWLFALLALSPPSIETFVMLVFPIVLVIALLLVPFISRRGERAPRRRPVAVLSVLILSLLFGLLTYEGYAAPWSPHMTAWSEDPIPPDIVKRSTPLELVGAAMFQNKDCRNCHALEGVGGRRGPDLTFEGARLPAPMIIDQIANGTPGGGNMPSYGKHVSSAEMEAMAAFISSLRPPGHVQPHFSAPPSKVRP